MLITSGVVELKRGEVVQAKEHLTGIPGVEARGVSDDMSRILLIIEAKDSDELEKISERIKDHPAVVSLMHHSFYFDEGE